MSRSSCTVEERRLIEVADRVRHAQRRNGDDVDARRAREERDGLAERGLAIAEVGSEARRMPAPRPTTLTAREPSS